MANTLTGLYQVIYAAFDVVSRELIGFIPAVSMDAQAEQVTLNQNIRSPVVPAMPATDINPSNISETGASQTIEYVNVDITKERKVSFHLTAEEEKGLEAGGTMPTITRDRFVQAFRSLSNEIETDLAALYLHASRAYGTNGTTPFGTADNLSDLSQVGKILDDNGAPMTGRTMILNTTALANLQGRQPSVFRVNESGEPMGRRMGAIGMLLGFDIGVSGQLPIHPANGNTDLTTLFNNAAGYPKGSTDFVVDGGGAGEIASPGDLVTVAGGSELYLVRDAYPAAGVAMAINAPGLVRAAVDDTAIINTSALRAAYHPSVAFTRDAFHLAVRTPAVPAGGDAAADRMYVTDPHSGLAFEISVYRQYRQVSYEVALCWGVKTVKPEHAALLLG